MWKNLVREWTMQTRHMQERRSTIWPPSLKAAGRTGINGVLFFAVALCSLGVTAQAPTPDPNPVPTPLPIVAWTTANIEQLKTMFRSAADVNGFLLKLSEDDFAAGPNARDWAFVDFGGDGNVELVVTLDPGGRDFVNQLVCVQETSKGFEWKVIDGFRLVDLPSRIAKLGPDDQRQLIVEQLLSAYNSQHAIPSIPHVFAWTKTGLVQSDSSYKEYYKTVVLPGRQRALQAEITSQEGACPGTVAAYTTEIAAIQAIINKP
jgi:hypothetical protein